MTTGPQMVLMTTMVMIMYLDGVTESIHVCLILLDNSQLLQS